MIDTSLFDKMVEGQQFVPSDADAAMYLFFDKGVSFLEFVKLPIPYIVGMINTHSYVKQLEEKELKKAQRRKK